MLWYSAILSVQKAVLISKISLAFHSKPLTPGPPTHGHAESNFLSVIHKPVICYHSYSRLEADKMTLDNVTDDIMADQTVLKVDVTDKRPGFFGYVGRFLKGTAYAVVGVAVLLNAAAKPAKADVITEPMAGPTPTNIVDVYEKK